MKVFWQDDDGVDNKQSPNAAVKNLLQLWLDRLDSKNFIYSVVWLIVGRFAASSQPAYKFFNSDVIRKFNY